MRRWYIYTAQSIRTTLFIAVLYLRSNTEMMGKFNLMTIMFLSVAAIGTNSEKGEKPGSCPTVRKNQVGICVNLCSSDFECKRLDKCCSNGCGRTCTRAVGNPTIPACSQNACSDKWIQPKNVLRNFGRDEETGDLCELCLIDKSVTQPCPTLVACEEVNEFCSNYQISGNCYLCPTDVCTQVGTTMK